MLILVTHYQEIVISIMKRLAYKAKIKVYKKDIEDAYER